MNLSFRIRVLRADELDDALDLIADIFPESCVEVEGEDTVLVAEMFGKLVGFAHIVDNEEYVVLQGLGVAKKFRGFGAGTALMERFLEMYCNDDRPIYLKVKADNPSMGLYARYGFCLDEMSDPPVLVKKQHT